MKRLVVSAACVMVAAAACHGSSPASRPSPSSTPTASEQPGVLAINQVLDTRPLVAGGICPTAAQAFSNDEGASHGIVACDYGSKLVLLLGPPALDQTDIRQAQAELLGNGIGWVVDVRFTGRGARRFLALTKAAYEATGAPKNGFGTCQPPKGCNAIAIVYNGIALEEPTVEMDGIPGGIVQISGLSRTRAESIAASLPQVS